MAFLQEYEVLKELGKSGGGSFAQVYLVQHKTHGYMRAIRVLKSTIFNEKDKEYQDFLKESRFLMRLGNGGHPNISRIFQPRLIDNRAFWEMDYIEGHTVDGYIEQNNGFVPIDEVNRFALDISNALAYCHVDNYWFSLSRDDDRDLISTDPNDGSKLIISDENRKKLIRKYAVVHNDIKSNNIMRKYDGTYILIDFGLAFSRALDKDLQDFHLSSSLMNNGGIGYKAPEKWDGKREDMTERTDIYSFGIVLYEMLAGCMPFPYDSNFSLEKNMIEISEHHKHTPPPAIEPLRRAAFEAANPGKTYTKDYPEWLEKVIMKCLEKKPENRYPNGKELYEEVKAHIEKDAQDALSNKTVEKIVYVDKPVEKIVEQIIEKTVEVPVEKIVYVENTVPKTASIQTDNGIDTPVKEPKRFSWKKTILWSVAVLIGIIVLCTLFLINRPSTNLSGTTWSYSERVAVSELPEFTMFFAFTSPKDVIWYWGADQNYVIPIGFGTYDVQNKTLNFSNTHYLNKTNAVFENSAISFRFDVANGQASFSFNKNDEFADEFSEFAFTDGQKHQLTKEKYSLMPNNKLVGTRWRAKGGEGEVVFNTENEVSLLGEDNIHPYVCIGNSVQIFSDDDPTSECLFGTYYNDRNTMTLCRGGFRVKIFDKCVELERVQ